jgi:hypothetical protein
MRQKSRQFQTDATGAAGDEGGPFGISLCHDQAAGVPLANASSRSWPS